MPVGESLIESVFWSTATVGAYLLVKRVHRRWRFSLISPIVMAPLLLLVLTHVMREEYRDYARATHWLILMLGPAIVAFAIPIYQRRHVISAHWPALVVGVAAGSGIAIASAWAVAILLGLPEGVRLSLLSRSISTPFAMSVSRDIGGTPELTAIFVIITGLVGASLGQLLLKYLPLRSALARGALFGMGAHSVGVASAAQIGRDEGSIASLVMIFAGLSNVLMVPVIMYTLR